MSQLRAASVRPVLVIGLILAAMVALAAGAQAPATYVVDPAFPLPEARRAPTYRRGEITGVATHPDGRVFVCHGTYHPMLVFNRDGSFRTSWGAGTLYEPHSVRVDSDGNLWVADFQEHQVFKFTPEGRVLLKLGVRRRAGRDTSHFNGPTDVAFGPTGDVYVADGYGNARVVRFTSDGQYVSEWGSGGRLPGRFHTPHSIAADPQGRIYVADRGNKRIQVFTPEGELLSIWRTKEKPWGLYYYANRMYVANGGPGSVTVYDLSGNLLSRWGRGGRRVGRIAEPHMLCLDERGVLYTAELAGHRVQRWLPQ